MSMKSKPSRARFPSPHPALIEQLDDELGLSRTADTLEEHDRLKANLAKDIAGGGNGPDHASTVAVATIFLGGLLVGGGVGGGAGGLLADKGPDLRTGA
jgi:hypothetical protein